MNSLLANDWVLIPLVGILVFLAMVLRLERILNFLQTKGYSEREFIFEHLEKMFVDISREKASQLHYAVSFGLGILGFFLVWPNWVMSFVLFGILTAVGWILPRKILENMWKNRCKLVVNQMVDGLTIMANGIKAGLSPQQSMERVIENIGGPIGQEFGLVLAQVRIGKSLEEALLEFGDRINEPEVQMFVTSIVILKETGGNLAETFETTVLTIRDRQKVEKKIEAMTAQGIMQGIIITSVPFVILAVLFFVDATFVAPLFTTTLGIIILMVVIALQIVGGLMIRKIVDIKV